MACVFFVCDLQTRFRTAIHEFEAVVATANKMLKVAKCLDIPVVVTEQNPLALGPTVPEIDLEQLGSLHLATVGKKMFSMYTPEVQSILQTHNLKTVVLFGIESHVCVLHSALDLKENGYEVHVLADGVSSCNQQEIPFALSRMRQAGANITTSESMAFLLQRDAGRSNFRDFAAIMKDEKATTQKTLEKLLKYESVL